MREDTKQLVIVVVGLLLLVMIFIAGTSYNATLDAKNTQVCLEAGNKMEWC